jgi:Flp pilus assembly protein TadD
MKKETILLVVVTLVVGSLGGMIFSNTSKKSAPAKLTATSAPVVDYQQKIKVLEEVVGKEPDNRNAWVQLGHNYFDSGQQIEAIEAYSKALELDDNDPDVLTDQGIMYRQVGWFDKAITNFVKANELNPNHPQSLFNLGLVYRDDLHDTQKAKEAWTRYLEIVSSGKSADNVRTMLDHMENGH